MADSRWQFWIDVGGTFTDCMACRPDGTMLRHKLLSSGVTKGRVAAGSTAAAIVDPQRTEPPEFFRHWRLRLSGAPHAPGALPRVAAFDRDDRSLRLERPLEGPPVVGLPYELVPEESAPLVAIRHLLGLAVHDPIPACAVRLGTTRGTNALLTRRGASTAFVTTRGFGDALDIGYQSRPKLFALEIRKAPPLYQAVLEIDERVAADGSVLRQPNLQQVTEDLSQLREKGIESLAICLLHADLYPEHECKVAGIARELGFAEVSVSHEVAAMPRLVARGDTTALDAYLNPVLRTYVGKLQTALPDSNLRLLTSSGGLVEAEEFRGKESILSGPAGGAVAFARVAQACGFPRAIGLDMGGTSTDVARYDGRHDLEYEGVKAGVRIVSPMLAIETVAAGGGSVCRFDGVKLVVGPESAGADPGPACYGRGGPLCVTDLNLYLGRIGADALPFELDRDAVERRLAELRAKVEAATGRSYPPAELVQSLLDIANANMAAAIRTVTVARGASAGDYPLVGFGGAAPQHVCAIAEQLQIKTVILHPDAGILSALGAGLAQVTRHAERGLDVLLEHAVPEKVTDQFEELEQDVRQELRGEGIEDDRTTVQRRLDIRYAGTDWPLTIDEPVEGGWAAAFHAEHERLFGYARPGHPIRAAAVRVQASAEPEWSLPPSQPVAPHSPEAIGSRHVRFETGEQHTPLYKRSSLQPGARLAGPAIVHEPHSTLVIDPGWEGEVYSQGEIVLHFVGKHAAPGLAAPDQPDPAQLEIFNNLLMAVAEQMGHTLRRTALSVNIKERLDFSCAIFTSEGRLVANAPHVPVHLGAMSETVRWTLRDNPQMQPGDVFVTNDPYRGGSHLPDVTVVSPVHEPATGALLFFTASRGHHAEIGGKTPGSMPPDARCLAEEGALIRNFLLVRGGESREDDLRALLSAGPYPSRAVDDNLADIRAQVAANRQGASDLRAMAERYTWPVVAAYMRHIQDAAAKKSGRALAARLPQGRSSFVDYIETADGESVPICVAIDRGAIDHGSSDADENTPVVTIDFSGTAPVLPSNLNANRAIVKAAVIYCLRLLIDEEIPLNEGVLDPVELILPHCFLNPRPGSDAASSPPVAGGNVETSQRVVDVILGAMGVAAASQGTMNNVILGDASFGYYETICGGSGATVEADGADAVQVHMTNTRITDPETLERRYPVRLWEFSIRRGSGGSGQHRGGAGAIREMEFLRPLAVAILSGRRGPHPPYGIQGGGPAALGRNLLTRPDGTTQLLPGICTVAVQAGDRLRIETPGGGGAGDASHAE